MLDVLSGSRFDKLVVMRFTFFPTPCRLSFALPVLACLASCSVLPKKEVVKNTLPEGAWWTHSPSEGSHKIVISLEEQRVALFRGEKPVGSSPISSGREGHSTRAGTYRVTEKDPAHRSSIYGAYCDESGAIVVEDVDVRKDPKPPGTTFIGADMQHFMRINGAIGMHRGYLPGYPASHGCIRLPGTMAALFFSATPEGTPVEIKDHAGLADLQPAADVAQVTTVESKTDFAQPKAAEPEAIKTPEATEAAPPPKGSGLTWFASAKKPAAIANAPADAESPKTEAPKPRDPESKSVTLGQSKKDTPPAAKKSWLASLSLPAAIEKSATNKTVAIKKPRQEPKTIPTATAYAPEAKISRPKPTVMEASKPQPTAAKISSKKSPKPGQTLYWNGN